MNKKAFVLMETIVVIVVISVALLTIFASYNKILSKVKTENKYDTSEYIYMTNYIKKFFKRSGCNPISQDITAGVTEYYAADSCGIRNVPGGDELNIKKIYILKNINGGDDTKFKKFDAYMIDYIRKLDVGDNDELIIVEYGRNALDDKGNEIYTSNCPYGYPGCESLTDTYIASLEWD